MELEKPTALTFVKILKIFGGIFIAVMLFLVFAPFFDKETPSARQLMALSNAKQMTQAASMYSTDYDGKYPRSEMWMDLLMPYLVNESFFHSPAISKEKEWKYGFAFKRNLGSVKITDIKSPEMEPLIFDSTNLNWNAAESLSTLPKPGRYQKAGGTHCNTISFCDGHARLIADTQDPRKG